MVIGPAETYIHYEPLGAVLIMSSWNYPILTLLAPLIYVIAAGNTCVAKPSELTSFTAICIQKFFKQFLDNKAYICI